MFLNKRSGLTNRQIKEVCSRFNCKKNEFAVQKYQDGFLVAGNNKSIVLNFLRGFFQRLCMLKKYNAFQRK